MPKRWMHEKAEMEKVLEEMDFGFLGMSRAGKSYVVPMSFAYQEGKVYLHTALKGSKLEFIKDNSQVCFTVAEQQQLVPTDDPCEFSIRYRSVIAQGSAKLLTDPEEKTTALSVIVNKYSKGLLSSPLEAKKAEAVAVIVIEIETMSGKYNVAK